jgi:hypothetical protein
VADADTDTINVLVLLNCSDAGVALCYCFMLNAVAVALTLRDVHTSYYFPNYAVCTLHCTGLGVLGAPAITSDAVVRLNYDASVCAVLTAMANHTTSARIQGLG